jgi:hypothetical protein
MLNIIDIDRAPPGRHFTGVPNLYLQVTPQGQRRYVFRYSRPHKHGVTEMSLGPASQSNWNATLLKVDKFRQQLADGVDPGAHRRQERRQQASRSMLRRPNLSIGTDRHGATALYKRPNYFYGYTPSRCAGCPYIQ